MWAALLVTVGTLLISYLFQSAYRVLLYVIYGGKTQKSGDDA
jgi:hypothetical protein